MRLLYLPVAFAALVATAGSSSSATVPPECPENALPIESAGKIDLEWREGLFVLAKVCMREGKPLRAVSLFSQVIRENPTDVAAYINRGSAQVSAGEPGPAISDFSVAIRLQPELGEAWYDRGTVLAGIGRYESAIADFTEAIRLRPDFALAYCNRALANDQIAHYDDALADYSIAIDRDPNAPNCRFHRGGLYLTLGYYQKAIDDFNAALALKSDDPIALSKRGQAYELLGQKNQALDDYRSALAASPGLIPAQEGLARLLAQQQQSNGTVDKRQSKVEATLKTDGYTKWKSIVLDKGTWEVDDAINAVGKQFDLRVDANTLKIMSQIEE